jgi:hypothetical protein
VPSERATAVLRTWAADQRARRIVLEARASGGQVRYLIGAKPAALDAVLGVLNGVLGGVTITATGIDRPGIITARRMMASTRHRALVTTEPHTQMATRALLGALTQARAGEEIVAQIVFGPPRVPLAIPNNSPSSVVSPWYVVALHGDGQKVDPEKRAALRDKTVDHGYACVVRIGVHAATPARRQALLLGVFAAMRTRESAGLRMTLRRDRARSLERAEMSGWRWPLRLNVRELTALTGWPLDADDLPGQPPAHPKRVAPRTLARIGDRIVATANAPGIDGAIGYSFTDATKGTWLIGPNGTGKSSLMMRLVLADCAANRPIVLLEPKDLVGDVLARIPDVRRDDVVVLDPTDAAPVGINPLQSRGRSPEVIADGIVNLFRALYGDQLGPRSTDVLFHALEVIARSDGASLALLLPMLSNAALRRKLTTGANSADVHGVDGFWPWFDSLSDDARSQIVAPLRNKLAPLLRPQLRAVLGQPQPRFDIRDVLTRRRILLVPLQPGVIGPEAAQLLSAVILSELWLALRERAAIPEARRTPVGIYVDEAQHYVRTATDFADILSTSRALRGAWHLAHQHVGQLPPNLRAAFESEARNRICFTLNASDARVMAAGQSVITPEDFTSQPAFAVYVRLLRDNTLQPWASGVTLPPPPATTDPDGVRRTSRQRYGVPREQTDADLRAHIDNTRQDDDVADKGRRRRQP